MLLEEKELKEKFFQLFIDSFNKINAEDSKVFYPLEYFEKYSTVLNMPASPDPEIFFSLCWSYFFGIAPDIKASKAIQDAIKGDTVLDCIYALQFCFLDALLGLLGEEKFNLIFSNSEFSTIRFDHSPCDFSEKNLFLISEKSNSSLLNNDKDINPGDWVHFQGYKDYSQKHPAGAWGGHQMFCFSKNKNNENLYIGFGSNPDGTGQTFSQVKQMLIDQYNEKESELEKKLQLAKSAFDDRALYTRNEKLVDDTISKDKETEVGVLQKNCSINLDRLLEFYNADISEIKAKLNKIDKLTDTDYQGFDTNQRILRYYFVRAKKNPEFYSKIKDFLNEAPTPFFAVNYDYKNSRFLERAFCNFEQSPGSPLIQSMKAEKWEIVFLLLEKGIRIEEQVPEKDRNYLFEIFQNENAKNLDQDEKEQTLRKGTILYQLFHQKYDVIESLDEQKPGIDVNFLSESLQQNKIPQDIVTCIKNYLQNLPEFKSKLDVKENDSDSEEFFDAPDKFEQGNTCALC